MAGKDGTGQSRKSWSARSERRCIHKACDSWDSSLGRFLLRNLLVLPQNTIEQGFSTLAPSTFGAR